ncbi:hypothetical protein FHS57_006280 [Runella defluvii]|uniref:Uncharacterized protein n=1 Tax=Runella defluvii TaxID=370973 RepID=A0A7W6ETY5_9BACT|nr:hypothetical protein [Runella defluvii]MBB3842249.1 hypothetical protein [Runella defluvii]
MNNIYIIKHLPINKGHPLGIGNDEFGITNLEWRSIIIRHRNGEPFIIHKS